MTVETPANCCPHCGYQVDRATSVRDDDVTPKEGDVTICIRCLGVCVFRADLTMRLPTLNEQASIREALNGLRDGRPRH